MLANRNKYKKINIEEVKKGRGYRVPNAKEIRFYPAKLNTKMDANYENVLYSSVSDYYDILNKDYFFMTDNNDDIVLPDMPPMTFTTDSGFQKTMTITMDYKKVQDIYTKYLEIPENIIVDGVSQPNPNYPFDLKKVNYFATNWNALNNKIEYSYWFVDSYDLRFDANTKEIKTITFHLLLDCYSEFYYIFWYYGGSINVLRQHNPRWIEDKIYGTGYYIPDFSSQRFVRNCDEYCLTFNDKVQRTQTVPMVSSRHWNAQNELPINDMFLQWDKNTYDAVVSVKKPLILLVCMRIDQYDASRGKEPNDEAPNPYSYYQGEFTNFGGYVEPYRYFAYVPSTTDGKPEQDELRKIVNVLNVDGVKTDDGQTTNDYKKYRIVSSIFMESIFDDNTFSVVDKDWIEKPDNIVANTLYRIPNGKLEYFVNQQRKEFYYFIEPTEFSYTTDASGNKIIDQSKQQPYLWPKMFKTRDDIVNVKKLDETNYDVEPHLFTNRHFSTDIGIFNKNGVSIDISTLLINNNTAFERAEIIQKQDGHYFTYKLLMRKGLAGSNMLDIKYFLLDQDTSVANKRDRNILTIDVVGNYLWPYYDNTFNEYIHNSQFRRQAGLDNIQQEYKTSKASAWLGFGGGLIGGGLSGSATGANTGIDISKKAGWIGGAVGGTLGMVGSAIGGALGIVGQLNQIEAQRQMALRSLNAQYDDAKNMSGNANVGSALTTQADMMFSAQLDDDIDPRNYNFIWTPKITFQQLKDYDCRSIAIYLNKMGYPQNQVITIEKSINELMTRFGWNRLQIGNADEWLKKDGINPQYYVDLAIAYMKPQGVCMWNADTMEWGDIFDWTLHNIEKIFDLDLMVLEGEIYG